ncbi:unnamed protein product [Staurois parvus]|uniref:Uncharacterized protein n=1 Tax=Staurois parvus TaxID=386267 RepID=A0ABN9FMZ2_9NEOB|nr:unnamed protein product [Staurois parvus]
MGSLLTPGPWAVPEFPNGQSAPACDLRHIKSQKHLFQWQCKPNLKEPYA